MIRKINAIAIKKAAMMRPTSTICLAFMISLGVAAAQTGSAPSPRKDVYAELMKAPKKAVERRNPLEADSDAVLAGWKLFEQHCSECHGEMAEGAKKGPSLRAPEVQQATPGTIFWVLTNGVVRRGMPVWSKLPEPQRWQLVSYIKALTPAAKPGSENTPPHQSQSSGHESVGSNRQERPDRDDTGLPGRP
jgi:mono/diheme cytochrome c family protein